VARLAEADLDAAGAMWRTRRYLYAVVGAQLAAEKALKAVLQERADVPPRIHDLEAPASRAGLGDETMLGGLRPLTGYYVAGRYPGAWDRLRDETTRTVVKRLMDVAKQGIEWSRQTLDSGGT
jgi:HEPN domain-containing protein